MQVLTKNNLENFATKLLKNDKEVKNELEEKDKELAAFIVDESPNVFDSSDVQKDKRFASVTSGYIMDSVGHIISGKIPCKDGDIVRVRMQYQGSYLRVIAWYDSSDSRISSTDLSVGGDYEGSATAPSGATYFKLCCYTYEGNVNEGTWTDKIIVTINKNLPDSFSKKGEKTLKSHLDYEGMLKLITKTSTKFVESSDFFIPDTVYGIKNRYGRNRVVPIENLLVSNNPDEFYLSLNQYSIYTDKGSAGVVLTDTSDNGTPIYVKNRLNDEQCYKNTLWSRLVSADDVTDPATEKNVLMIGDSFTDLGVLPCEVKRNLNEDLGLTNISFVGHKEDTKDGVVCKNCGIGGITVKDYVKTNNSEGRGAGTWSNPFLYNGTVSLTDYMAAHESGKTIDICVIECGVNDLITWVDRYDTIVDETVQNMLTLIDAIHAQYPDCKIFVVGQKYISDIQTDINAYKFNKLVLDLNRKYQSLCKTKSDYCTYVDIALMFDRVYFSQYKEVPIYKGSTETCKVVTDWLHPNDSGYYSIAENISGAIAYTLFKN